MRIETTMNLNSLAERMGSEATTQDAENMRGLLNATAYRTTEDVPESEWLAMVEKAAL